MGEMVDTHINGNWHLLLPQHRADRAEWYTAEGWERERLDAMHKSIRHSVDFLAEAGYGDQFRPLVMDIGAEEGDFAALFAQWGADVFAVEPNPRVWPNIKAIFEANEYVDQFAGYYIGLCDRAPNNIQALGYDTRENGGWPEMAYGPLIGDHGFVSLVETRNYEEKNKASKRFPGGVPITTIDNIVDTLQRGPHIITMDVEGAEFNVLGGAVETLKFFKPEVFISIHPDMLGYDYGASRESVLRFMQNLGYTCEWIACDHEEHWRFWLES